MKRTGPGSILAGVDPVELARLVSELERRPQLASLYLPLLEQALRELRDGLHDQPLGAEKMQLMTLEQRARLALDRWRMLTAN
ncbi:MAG: hypothetical protein GY778_32355 [bacterium]|nr:hypothetical protein [bacterium]